MQPHVSDKVHPNRKRPCSSPFSESEQASPVASVIALPSQQGKKSVKNLKRIRDSQNVQKDIDMEGLSNLHQNEYEPRRILPPVTQEPISRNNSSNSNRSVDASDKVANQDTHRSRVRAFIAAFEKGGKSDPAKNHQRPPCWKKQDRTAHSVERLPQLSSPRVLEDTMNQRLIRRAPSFHGEVKVRSESKVEPVVKRTNQREVQKHQVHDVSHHRSVASEDLNSGISNPDSFSYTENSNDFRKVLRKTSFNPVSPSFAKCYEPVSQTDFRNVLRNNRR